ncbi:MULTISPECIES: Rieske 2Fe-2S domain-containing protein [Methylocaldum]|uniref:Rieske 2Fe-2S domain-containing protein n=1 Tax=unclassified Methylocaldum TaxID=2622260 RepID=UPI00098BA0CD|nr:Rieske 2Fe-2S domain-containing protein [Methylocaldum sp. 14B]MDV3240577.1 Rieske 2Fe-2S domain-containing protein [Methylocaldum sp.]MVF20033.1 (2Fe-2S)-binding protein [Methylocaldum sp. BRCS4]
MSYTSLCKHRNLGEGDMVPFTVEGREILLVWPDGGELKAFQGTCPHHNARLKYGGFNGRTITCTFHNWVFDARTGQGLIPPRCALEEYPLRVEDGMVQVDLSGCSPS